MGHGNNYELLKYRFMSIYLFNNMKRIVKIQNVLFCNTNLHVIYVIIAFIYSRLSDRT